MQQEDNAKLKVLSWQGAGDGFEIWDKYEWGKKDEEW